MDQNSMERNLHGDAILVGEISMGQASRDELPKATTSSLRISTHQISMGLLGQLLFQELQLHL